MTKYAVLNADQECVNVILWDGSTDYDPGDGLTLRSLDGEPNSGIGWRLLNTGVWQPPQPYQSWTWDGEQWIAPTPRPSEGGLHTWDEKSLSWVHVEGDA